MIFAAVLAAVISMPLFMSTTRRSAAQTTAANGGQVSYAQVPAGTYNLDPAHSLIGFAVRHLEINLVGGRFKDFTGKVSFDDRDVTRSTVEFTAKIASIDTEVAARDKHLLSADFFEAEKYPEMAFKSTGVKKTRNGDFILSGDLTLKGVTKQIEFPFTFTGAIKDPWGNTRFGIEAHTRINRRDYGINYGNALPMGGFDVANEVAIDLRLEAFKPEPKPAAAAGK